MPRTLIIARFDHAKLRTRFPGALVVKVGEPTRGCTFDRVLLDDISLAECKRGRGSTWYDNHVLARVTKGVKPEPLTTL